VQEQQGAKLKNWKAEKKNQNRSRNPPPSSGSPTENFYPGKHKNEAGKKCVLGTGLRQKIKQKIPLKNVRFAGHFQIFIKLSLPPPTESPLFSRPAPLPTKSAHKSRVCVCGSGERPKGCQKHLN